MTGDKHRITVTNHVLFDALASGRLTWWGQYNNDGVQVQRGDTIVFHLSAANVRGERPRPLNMAVTDARDVTAALPISGSEQTGDVLIVRVLSLRPADAPGGLP